MIEDNVGCAEDLESLVRAAVADIKSIPTANTAHNEVTCSEGSVYQHLIVAQGDAGRRGGKAVNGDVRASYAIAISYDRTALQTVTERLIRR